VKIVCYFKTDKQNKTKQNKTKQNKTKQNTYYKILESYIDDMFVNAQTKEELFKNLTLIFDLFRKYKITFNQDKVHLSDIEMEFVGHEFTHDGIQFNILTLRAIYLKYFGYRNKVKKINDYLNADF